MSRPRQRVSISLPGEDLGRRSFLTKGIVGGVLLVAGGGLWLGTRHTRPVPAAGAPLQVFSPQEAAVLLAVADRLVPERRGFPRPVELRLPEKIDGIAAMAHPANQTDLRRLVRLFENALGGLLLDGQPSLFTTLDPAGQDRRLAAWARSRIALRRTGYRALKRLVFAAYYSSPETWAAVGYPGPPLAVSPLAGSAPTAPVPHGPR